MEPVSLRFARYISYDTTSDENQSKSPSTDGQFALANALKSELEEMDITNVNVDNNGYLTATIPSNCNHSCPSIGFIAHLDTSPEAIGSQVKARKVLYDGTPIVLNDTKTLSAKQFPELDHYIGQEIIVTDGNTLLGADDKAGIAEIMAMIEYFFQNPHIPHGAIQIAFTPDEEIGRGAYLLDVPSFGAEWAYTIDGGEIGELEYENFNAASAEITITGRNVHPGSAKGKMINATRLASLFISLLPEDETPERTENYEGFIHVTAIEGNVSEVKIKLIIRDHDFNHFTMKKECVRTIADRIKKQCEDAEIKVEIKDQYRNMLEKILPVMHVVDIAKQAMANCGVQPIIKPIRGGTDGANLSFRGLPCPNLFAGGVNFHSCYEFIPIPSMKKAVDVLIEICRLAEKSSK